MGSNDSDNKEYIISVESRKGGVGKTTAALCLAKLLLEKGYAVLFLDLDITGTNAADIKDSLYWKDILNIVVAPADKTKESSQINLIELFHNDFMSGKNSLEIKYEVNKINLLGSHLYNSKQTKGGVTCIEKPGVLFDELHGYWLLEFIKQIIGEFKNSINPPSGEQKPLAVILDNSPGYMGLSPLIHDWLTDNGPIFNKFLIVSSLDRQDLKACEMSVNKLYKFLENKSDAGALYEELSKEEEKANPSKAAQNIENIKKHKKLLMKLATSDKNSPLVESYLNQEKTEQKEPPFQTYRDDPKLYMATIINKVPEEDYEIAYPYKYQNITPFNVFKSLLSVDNNFINKERMISYVSSIEKQFYINTDGNQDSEKENSEKVQPLVWIYKEGLHKMKTEYFSLLKGEFEAFDKEKVLRLVRKYEYLLEKSIKNVFPQENNISLYIKRNLLLYDKLSALSKKPFPEIHVGRYSHRHTRTIPIDIKQLYRNIKDNDSENLLKNSLEILSSNSIYDSLFFRTLLMLESEYLYKKQTSPEDFPKEIANMPYFWSYSLLKSVSYNSNEIKTYFREVLKIQAQILDYPNDIEFIFDFLELIVRNPKNFNIYRKIGTRVINGRSLSHKDGKKELGKVNYYSDFELVLSDIVEQWGITNE